jgi:sulfopropanediol 3-dehydrogenase
MKKLMIEELKSDFFEPDDLEEVDTVKEIIADVRERGDAALKEYTLRFDGVDLTEMEVSRDSIEQAAHYINGDLFDELRRAAVYIEKFALRQRSAYQDFEYEITKGVMTAQRVIPIDRVGLYVPGGHYPLVSSLIMGVIPAKVAGVREVNVCTPPRMSKDIHPALLVAADITGVDRIFMLGGAQAIAAMAYGTQTITRVDKIVGPGNIYVNAAKKIVHGRVGIDFIAGPTETMIIADETCNSTYLASDLIAQAEHDPRAEAYLVTFSEKIANEVLQAINSQLESLPTAKIARRSLEKNGLIIIVDNLDEAFSVANRKAPEHLQLCIQDAKAYISRLKNYGSLFVGSYSAETLGDYSCGVNHILPTNGAARYTGGLSVRDFLKVQTVVEVNREGLLNVGLTAEILARVEGLEGHALAIQKRLASLL